MASPPRVCIGSEAEILNEPLSTSKISRSFQILYDIVHSCYGFRGRLKALHNANSTALTLTSASSVLLHRMSCKNPFVSLIVGCSKNHSSNYSDCGLLKVLIILSFLLSSLSINIPKMLFADLNDHIAKMCMDYLESIDCRCVIKIQMDTVAQFRSVVKTVLSSKPGCVLSQNEREHIGLLILKSFLNIVPSSVSGQLGHINIISCESICPMQSNAFPGVVIPCSISAEKLYDEKFKSKLKLLLFITSLSGDAEFPVKKLEVQKGVHVWKEILDHLRILANKIIALKIHILLCQKVVHPVIKEQLEKKGIMVLDRLGTYNAQIIQQSTGAHPIQSIFLPDVPDLFGYVDSAHILKIDEKLYINFQCSDKVWTLLICHSIVAALEETMIVCRQAVDALCRIIVSKKALFGAGCMETAMAAFINNKVHDTIQNIRETYRCTDSQVLTVANNFIKILHNIAVSSQGGKIYDYMTDDTHHHLWESVAIKCSCGQFFKHNLPNAKWIYLNINSNKVIADSVFQVEHDVILDEYSNKKHAYSTSFDLISLLLRTGTCIIDKN